MSIVYADTSALARAYFADEAEHAALRESLLEAEEPVVTSVLTRVELAGAIRAAAVAGRLRNWREVVGRVDADCGADGPITLLDLRPSIVLPTAYALVLDHRLRALGAIHVAVAAEECRQLAAGEEVVFVTRDRDQAKAARALDLAVR